MAKIGRPKKYPTTWTSKHTGVEWMRLEPDELNGKVEIALEEARRTYAMNKVAKEALRQALSEQFKTDLDLKWNRFGLSITPRRSAIKAKKSLVSEKAVSDWLSNQ